MVAAPQNAAGAASATSEKSFHHIKFIRALA
jgi:hypothetical protein